MVRVTSLNLFHFETLILCLTLKWVWTCTSNFSHRLIFTYSDLCVVNMSSESHDLFTMQLYASTVYAVVMCLSVHLSVIHQYCLKMAQHRITETMPHGSSSTLGLGKIWMGSPAVGMPNASGCIKIDNSWQITHYNLKTVQYRRIVTIKVE